VALSADGALAFSASWDETARAGLDAKGPCGGQHASGMVLWVVLWVAQCEQKSQRAGGLLSNASTSFHTPHPLTHTPTLPLPQVRVWDLRAAVRHGSSGGPPGGGHSCCLAALARGADGQGSRLWALALAPGPPGSSSGGSGGPHAVRGPVARAAGSWTGSEGGSQGGGEVPRLKRMASSGSVPAELLAAPGGPAPAPGASASSHGGPGGGFGGGPGGPAPAASPGAQGRVLQLATASDDGQVRLWEVRVAPTSPPRQQQLLPSPAAGPSGPSDGRGPSGQSPAAVAAAAAPTPVAGAGGGAGGEVTARCTAALLRAHQGPVSGVAFVPGWAPGGGRPAMRLLTTSFDGSGKLWDLQEPSP
jgi:hypothetical protein